VEEEIADAAYLKGDVIRVKQIVLNLLSNAIKYNRPGGSVRVRSERRDDMICVSIEDTGYGISRENIERLYEPFQRLGKEYSGIEGTGIGLMLSRSLVESMGGEMGVESTPDEGSTFWFTIPVPDDS
jgi:signal transduction histidine kinase